MKTKSILLLEFCFLSILSANCMADTSVGNVELSDLAAEFQIEVDKQRADYNKAAAKAEREIKELKSLENEWKSPAEAVS